MSPIQPWNLRKLSSWTREYKRDSNAYINCLIFKKVMFKVYNTNNKEVGYTRVIDIYFLSIKVLRIGLGVITLCLFVIVALFNGFWIQEQTQAQGPKPKEMKTNKCSKSK